jgi:hypothetical protein
LKGYWDNLRPLEKRMVVGIAVMFFVILNAWFVFPHFSDMGQIQQRMIKARKLLTMYETEIRQKPKYEEGIKRLQGPESQPIPLEDQAGAFADTIRSEADRNHVQIQNFGRIIPRTNDQFFWEQTATITVLSKEQNLVDFLYNLGSVGLVRVRDLTLRPEMPARQQLSAGIKLVASYQKKTPSKTAASPAPAPAKTSIPTPQPAAPVPKPPASATKQSPTTKIPSSAGKSAAPTNKPPASTTKKT